MTNVEWVNNAQARRRHRISSAAGGTRGDKLCVPPPPNNSHLMPKIFLLCTFGFAPYNPMRQNDRRR
ncbi:MAG TPA: hypothetical protein PLJ62_08300, partial [Thermoflexales bacterium]|nr:hypothetical protein [Thermoflexales bacterium]